MKSILLTLMLAFWITPDAKRDTTINKEYVLLTQSEKSDEEILNDKIYNTSVLFIKSQESIRLKPYKCKGNSWTIGWGHTMTKKERKKFRKGITISQADSLFDADYSKIIKNTKDNFPKLESYKKIIVTSMISYNIGTKFMYRKLGRAIRYNKDIKPYLLKYKYSKGKVLRGLVKRRKAELQLWNASPDEFIAFSCTYEQIVENHIKKIL